MTSETSFPQRGGCTCGEIRFEVTSKPLFVHCCHCRWCQRETGSAFALNAMIEADRVHLLKGDLKVVNTLSHGGEGQKISRCPSCHVAVWSNYGGHETVRLVRVGTLDVPNTMPPDIHIFTSTKQSWVILDPETPAVSEYYSSSKLWPAESLVRRKALTLPIT